MRAMPLLLLSFAMTTSFWAAESSVADGPTQSLSGTWTLRGVEGAAAAIPIQVPGDVHSALLAAGRIPDPYVGDNEEAVQWVGDQEWIEERTFDATAELLRHEAITLVVDDVDTYATFTLNGQVLGDTGNRFRRYTFDAKPWLRPTGNTLSVRFRSAARVAADKARTLPFPIPHIFGNGTRTPYYNLNRKPMCHNGWDWGIGMMAVGLEGRVELVAHTQARIDAVTTTQQHHAEGVDVTVQATVAAVRASEQVLRVRLGEQTCDVPAHLTAGTTTLQATLRVINPRKWWPNDLGDAYLYPLEVSIAGATVSKHIGLRTIEVVTTPDADGKGARMGFRVNGVDIFAKGANWIPTDALPQRQTRERYAQLVGSAQAAHMNMLRVWGGGQFEQDAFYEECDRRGILIWHDLMFACALYPSTPDFLAEVRAEVAHQVTRLRDHACIALWCGDNECMGALSWFEESRKNRDRYLVNYDRLNRLLGDTVTTLDTRTFWPSSPSWGPDAFGDAFHNDAYGDMHYWTVWHAGKDFSAYYAVRPRFCSEFGFQSLSSPELVATFCPPEQRNPTAPLFEFHQKNNGGNARILETMARYFRHPEGFEHLLYVSQVQQALAITTAVEAWRHQQPRCQGTLYWQLNDVWPVASWSSIEYHGRWKPLHHAARRFFAPVAVMVTPADRPATETAAIANATVPAVPANLTPRPEPGYDPEQVEVWAVNDRREPIQVTAEVEVWTYAGQRLETLSLLGRVTPGQPLRLGAYPVTRFCPTAPERNLRFLAITMTYDHLGQREVVRTQHAFAPMKRCPLADAQVLATPQRHGDAWTVTLSTDHPAWYTWLETPGVAGEFDDNFLLALPGRPVTLTFHPGPGATWEAFTAALHLRHLRQTYR